MTQEQKHIFHLTTKLSVGTILYGFVVGCIMVGAPSFAYHVYAKQENRLAAIETEIYHYRERAWLFRIVEEKLTDQKSQVRYDVAEAIYTLAKSKQVPISTILAIIEVESEWDLTASNGAAMGVMQIDAQSAAHATIASKATLQRGALYNPVTNIIAGTSYLASIHKAYVKDKVERDTEFDPSLCAYNSGRILSSKSKQISNFDYALKVKRLALQYEELFKKPL
jgi:soluble lytic murein transglycosylase-like protein